MSSYFTSTASVKERKLSPRSTSPKLCFNGSRILHNSNNDLRSSVDDCVKTVLSEGSQTSHKFRNNTGFEPPTCSLESQGSTKVVKSSDSPPVLRTGSQHLNRELRSLKQTEGFLGNLGDIQDHETPNIEGVDHKQMTDFGCTLFGGLKDDSHLLFRQSLPSSGTSLRYTNTTEMRRPNSDIETGLFNATTLTASHISDSNVSRTMATYFDSNEAKTFGENVRSLVRSHENSNSFKSTTMNSTHKASLKPPPVAKKPVRSGSVQIPPPVKEKPIPLQRKPKSPHASVADIDSIHANHLEDRLGTGIQKETIPSYCNELETRIYASLHQRENQDMGIEIKEIATESREVTNKSQEDGLQQFKDAHKQEPLPIPRDLPQNYTHTEVNTDSTEDVGKADKKETDTQVSKRTALEFLPVLEGESIQSSLSSHKQTHDLVTISNVDMDSRTISKTLITVNKRNNVKELVQEMGILLENIHTQVEECDSEAKSDSLNRGSVKELVQGMGSLLDSIRMQAEVCDTPVESDIVQLSSSDASFSSTPPPTRSNIHDGFSSCDCMGAEPNNAESVEITACSESSGQIVSELEVNAVINLLDLAIDCDNPVSAEHLSETKKRLSSTPNYESWTTNRAITSKFGEFDSVSDDDELDEMSTSFTDPCHSVPSPVFSKTSCDSGMCEDMVGSDRDPFSGSDPARGCRRTRQRAQGDTSMEYEEDCDEPIYFNISNDDEAAVFDRDVELRPHPGGADDKRQPHLDRLSVDTPPGTSEDDEDASTTGSCHSYDETESAREGMLKMRQLLVKGVLDSEKSYLVILSVLIDYKRSLEACSLSSHPVISKDDIHAIFSNIEAVNDIHAQFVKSLEPKVKNWTHGEIIGEIFEVMISSLSDYGIYLNNLPLAMRTIHRCRMESTQFDQLAMAVTIGSTIKEVSNLEDTLFKPVQRVQRNTLVLHDLIKYTPKDHPDYDVLQKTLKLSQKIIEQFATMIPLIRTTQEKRRLVKSSFLVEHVAGVRKLRYVFLFSDVLVCTKRDTGRNNKTSFGIKWFAPLNLVSIDTRFAYTDDAKSSKKDDIQELKSRLRVQKKDLKAELRRSSESVKHRALVSLSGGGNRNVEKLSKKVNQTEAQLILASPKLPFKVLIEGGKSYTLLMSTDYEREEWKETIASLLSRADPTTPSMSSIFVQELVNSVKETPQVNKIGNVLLRADEDMLTGELNVTIHKVNGLSEVCDTYCNIEMDSFGHFFFKARTKICKSSRDPAWNEDFDLELDGSQTLRVLCFKKEPGNEGDKLLGRGALELSKKWLAGRVQETTLSMNEISLVISVRHTPADKTMQRTPSLTRSAVFGVNISACVKREGKTVPTIITACVQEVEKRGLDEVGIYRVSGVATDLQNLKKLMDKNARAGIILLQDADIHTVTGVLKMYLRELPEPLFTESNYQRFIDTLKLSDEEAKTQCMLALLHSLPDSNYYTAVYLLEHLLNIARNVGENKMSIHNLSTIFGPTLLAPASKQDSKDPLEMMFKGAEQIMQQSSVINFLLGLAVSGKSLRRSAQ